MYILGLIPARGGSKRFPRKNVALLKGKPLLAHTADAARQARGLSRVLLSTDDREIADMGVSLGLEVPFKRPEALASDESLAIDVILHTLHWLEDMEECRPDAVMLLQPTSPMRTSQHIDEACKLLTATGADSIVSVTRVPHQYNPLSVMRIIDGRLINIYKGAPVTRYQEKPVTYARNGPALLLTRRHILVGLKQLYGNDCRPLEMARINSIDVDTPEDLHYLEFLTDYRRTAGSNQTCEIDGNDEYRS